MNRSEVVGRPLAALLANDGATVYSVDITGVQKFTRGEGIKKRMHEVVDLEGKTLKDVAPLCDVVICGVPGESYKLDTSLLREGAVCVNFSSQKVSRTACYYIGGSMTDHLRIELPTGSQGEGIHLCPVHREGDYCCFA